MKVYKHLQYLVFELDDGSQVRYDFANKVCIGKKGTVVQDLKSQLRGITMKDILCSCEDRNYANFLNFLRQIGGQNGNPITNIGTILTNAPRYAMYEQLFSAGLEKVDANLHYYYQFNDIPTGLIKLCRKHGTKLTRKLVEYYKMQPDAVNLAFNMEYASLDCTDIPRIVTYEKRITIGREINSWGVLSNVYADRSVFIELITHYGYTAKSLAKYIDYLVTFEAIDDTDKIMRELYDYVNMMSQISPKYDRYPRNFLTTHRIASRNFTRLNRIFNEGAFQLQIKPEMERVIDGFAFIYPKSTDEIKEEAVNMHHCVASYISNVIDGECDILFMRKADEREKSLVTCEVVNGKMVQYRQRFNETVTAEQRIAISKWEKWYQNKIKEAEYESSKKRQAAAD